MSSLDGVVRTFGDPAKVDRDAVETVLSYELGPIGREIELTPDERVKTFRIYRQ